MYKSILVPTDGSSCSEAAAKQALGLAKLVDGEVTFLYAIDPVPPALAAEAYGYAVYAEQLIADLRKAAEQALSKAAALAEAEGVRYQTRLEQNARPVDAIVAAMNAFDLVVMGSHGRTGVRRLILGSVTEGVMRQSAKPLLVVRCGGEGK